MNLAEEVLYSHLTAVDSLDVIAGEGFLAEISLEVIPTEVGRKLVAWCLDYYFTNGRKVAPTKAAIMETWGDQLEAVDIIIEDEEERDSVEWAIEQLRSEYARWRSEELVKQISMAVANADPGERVAQVQEAGNAFYLLGQSLISRKQESMLGLGLDEALQRYLMAEKTGESVRGMTFGMPEIDQHTGGIWPGQLAIMAGFSGVGKSWFASKVLLAEWERERRTVLFTLENDLDTTFDRLACMRAKVSYTKWSALTLDDSDIERVAKWIERFKESPCSPIVIMPQPGERDPVSLVRKARLLGADSMIIDQLSHMEKMPGSTVRERNQIVAEIARGLSIEIQGREALPCMLLHQIKREGDKEAQKTGHYVMTDMAETSEVERAATFVFAIYQSMAMKAGQRANLQELKARRGTLKDWELNWRLETGDIRVLREVVPA